MLIIYFVLLEMVQVRWTSKYKNFLWSLQKEDHQEQEDTKYSFLIQAHGQDSFSKV